MKKFKELLIWNVTEIDKKGIIVRIIYSRHSRKVNRIKAIEELLKVMREK